MPTLPFIIRFVSRLALRVLPSLVISFQFLWCTSFFSGNTARHCKTKTSSIEKQPQVTRRLGTSSSSLMRTNPNFTITRYYFNPLNFWRPSRHATCSDFFLFISGDRVLETPKPRLSHRNSCSRLGGLSDSWNAHLSCFSIRVLVLCFSMLKTGPHPPQVFLSLPLGIRIFGLSRQTQTPVLH